MFLIAISMILSVLIAGFGFLRGKNSLKAYTSITKATGELADRLAPCEDAGAFRKALFSGSDRQEPLVRQLASRLATLLEQPPLRVTGRTGWVADLENLCDGQHWFRSQPLYGSVEAMPGILTGIGILFTFLGLTVGVAGLDPTDADQLTFGVKKLLGGMSLAFLTSIAGIGTALWWTWRHKRVAMFFELAFGRLRQVLEAKPFLLPPNTWPLFFQERQEVQTQALASLEESVFRAFSKALAESGIGAMAQRDANVAKDGDLAAIQPVLEEIREALNRVGEQFGASSEVNRNMERILAQMENERDRILMVQKAEREDQSQLVTKTRLVLSEIHEIHKAQTETVAAIKEAGEELKKMMQQARLATADIINNHQGLVRHMNRLESHWDNYREQLQTMLDHLKHALSGFQGEMTHSLRTIHNEFDELLAKSLSHFSGALQELDATLDKLSEQVRIPPEQGGRKWFGKAKP